AQSGRRAWPVEAGGTAVRDAQFRRRPVAPGHSRRVEAAAGHGQKSYQARSGAAEGHSRSAIAKGTCEGRTMNDSDIGELFAMPAVFDDAAAFEARTTRKLMLRLMLRQWLVAMAGLIGGVYALFQFVRVPDGAPLSM